MKTARMVLEKMNPEAAVIYDSAKHAHSVFSAIDAAKKGRAEAEMALKEAIEKIRENRMEITTALAKAEARIGVAERDASQKLKEARAAEAARLNAEYAEAKARGDADRMRMLRTELWCLASAFELRGFDPAPLQKEKADAKAARDATQKELIAFEKASDLRMFRLQKIWFRWDKLVGYCKEWRAIHACCNNLDADSRTDRVRYLIVRGY